MSKSDCYKVIMSPGKSSAKLSATGDGSAADSDTITQLVLCKICISEYTMDKMYILSQCNCIFCLECVKMYVTTAITDGNVMSIDCPNQFCRRHGVIDESEIESLVSSDLLAKYSRLRYEQEIELDPSRTFCPRSECRAVCSIIPPASSGNVSFAGNAARPVDCVSCGTQFCSWCKSDWHDKQTCDENMMKSEGEIDGILFSSAEDANIKRCPTCRVPIERNSGCAQMMCRRCKHVFCWYCLAPLDDDFLLRHYDKGRCKNKLGHSRASVIWHRTQVVGIFAGFGVLLLIVSPFLLLAAPCLLCCRCRPCRHCDDLDNTTEMPQPPTSN